MLNIRTRKVARDLRLQWGRAIMVIVAMALGVAGVTAIVTSYYVAEREQRAAFLGADAPSATILADGLTPQALAAARTVPGVAAAETAATAVGARIRIPGEQDWVNLGLSARSDYGPNSIARLTLRSGTWPPPPGQIVIEQSSLPLLPIQAGRSVEVELPGNGVHTLAVAGTNSDPSRPPGWVEDMAYGFVTMDTLAGLGLTGPPRELRILVDGDRLSRDHIEAVSAAVTARLTAAGVRVTGVDIPDPGRHTHQDLMDAMLGLELLFGGLTVALSALLITTVVSALLAGQVRQIGTLKAVGARTGQIVAGYAGTVAVLGGIAALVGWPIGRLVGLAYVDFVSVFMNFEVADPSVPWWLVAAQLAGGLAVPALTVAVLLWRTARATAAQAMRDHGVAASATGRRAASATGRRARAAAWLSARGRLPRLPVLAGRNAFRRRGRLILAATALAFGGATFMAAGNVADGLEETFVNGELAAQPYDVTVALDRPYPADALTAAVAAAPGVSRVEGWLAATATIGAGDAVPLSGVPVDSPTLRLRILEGRMLTARTGHEIVVSQGYVKEHPETGIGSEVSLHVGGRDTAWRVVGIAMKVGAAAGWVSYDDLAEALGTAGTANVVRVVTAAHDETAVAAAERNVERALVGAGATVVGRGTLFDQRTVLEEHKVIFSVFLNLMTLISVVTGALGLAISLTVSVVERTREIGVLRAIGSTTRTLLGLVAMEAAVIGAVSWTLSLALAGPTTVVFDRLFGNLLFNTPLAFAVNGWTVAGWLAIVVLCCALASLVPARRAARMTVSSTLAYE